MTLIADGTDLHGDAVNVAARIQAECPPGGICVTRSVRDHVHGRLDLAFEELGALNLKNIARPVEAFVVRRAQYWPTVANRMRHTGRPHQRRSQGLHHALSIVRSPAPSRILVATRIRNTSADGITEDVTTDLSRIAHYDRDLAQYSVHLEEGQSGRHEADRARTVVALHRDYDSLAGVRISTGKPCAPCVEHPLDPNASGRCFTQAAISEISFLRSPIRRSRH